MHSNCGPHISIIYNQSRVPDGTMSKVSTEPVIDEEADCRLTILTDNPRHSNTPVILRQIEELKRTIGCLKQQSMKAQPINNPSAVQGSIPDISVKSCCVGSLTPPKVTIEHIRNELSGVDESLGELFRKLYSPNLEILVVSFFISVIDVNRDMCYRVDPVFQ